ncbi:Ku protein [Pseudaminobacter soli (ex Li et al. 2025)]|uniref:Ku domain-containing protein n=1 Tax=Pseudaminobacter soli (ex Li et al. 2025) TaxID=1295366 RepID=A0A2P7S1C9_9HYPH|nr:Ku protein [Mesorhizobium soli]PSJ56270.1 hypothetical protein C7I85_25215 [Mesorhizobium soli]
MREETKAWRRFGRIRKLWSGDKSLWDNAGEDRSENFVDVSEVEAVYRDRPYYLVPADNPATDPFALVREAMRKTKTAALATVVLW